MIDATFVVVPRPRNRREQNALIKQGVVQQEFSDHPAVGAHKNCDARWTKKKHETYYGYKDHVKVDVTGRVIVVLRTVPLSAIQLAADALLAGGTSALAVGQSHRARRNAV